MRKRLFTIVVLLFSIALYALLPAHAAPSIRDQLYLHYDVAPDRDDLHAITAGKQLADRHGLAPRVIIGAHSHHSEPNRWPYLRDEAIAIGDLNYGRGNYREVGYNHSAHFDVVASEWDSVIAEGGTVYVAEGGPSDFTYGVLLAMQQDRGRVTVVQHSDWNERMTDDPALAYVKSNTNYIRIEDGNQVNSTADLNVQGSQSNRNIMLATDSKWVQTFNLYDSLVDFSDTVELLHILDIPKSVVSDIQSFANHVSQAETNSQSISTTSTSSTESVTLIIEAEDYLGRFDGTADKAWEKRTQNSESGMQLLPDTRKTHNDQLIAGTNFWNYPGASTPYLVYQIDVPVTGRYLVEVRALSTGTEDNGAHLAIDGEWILERIQWCAGKNTWTYTSALRLDSNHCGVQNSTFITLEGGTREIWLGAREDGLFVDSIRLSLNGVITNVVTTASTNGSNDLSLQTLNNTDQCSVAGNNLAQAKELYAQQCSLPRLDCDFVGSRWICASFMNPADITSNESPEQTSASTSFTSVNHLPVEPPEEDTAFVPAATAEVTNSTGNDSQRCIATGSTVESARIAYDLHCSLPRLDCDPVGNQWLCASFFDPTVSSIGEQPIIDTSNLGSNLDTCVSVGTTLTAARTSYENSCSLPRVDCDFIGGGTWKCASYQIGNATPRQ